MKKNFIIGTSGHVDHGKTALIKALTGKDLDTHKEEKKRGLAAKDRLVEILEYNDNHCILRVSGLGKFGRALTTVHVKTLSPISTESSMTLIDVNKQLIEEGHATEYYGGKR